MQASSSLSIIVLFTSTVSFHGSRVTVSYFVKVTLVRWCIGNRHQTWYEQHEVCQTCMNVYGVMQVGGGGGLSQNRAPRHQKFQCC
jgi:hypothetical protein